VAWQLEGPLATIPATVTALPDLLLPPPPLPVDSLPSSGPAGEGRGQQEIDLGGLIRRAWEDLRVPRVHFALLGPAVRTLGERRALLQAWRELLRSAADAALAGAHSPPLVTVELDPSPEAVQILVHDSGPPLPTGEGASMDSPGVRPSALPYRGVSSDSDPGSLHLGAGMRRGLWLAQRTLNEQGALLALATPQLGGTSVRVTLPRSPRPLRTAA
jgi:signal transduction histidine kinase